MRYAGELAALGTALCWSVGFNLFAYAGRHMGSRALNRLRLPIALVPLALTLWLTRGAPWPWWATGTQLALLAASGLVGFVFGDGFNFKALVILGPGRGALLAGTAPLFTALFAWPLLGEHPGPFATLGMLMVVGGVMLARYERDGAPDHPEGSTTAGIAAGLLGAIGQAGGYVLSKLALRTGIDPLPATVIRVAAASVAIWAMALAAREARRTLATLDRPRVTATMVGGAICGPFLGVTLSLVALRRIEAGVAASLTAIHPLLAMAIAARFHGERPSWRTLAGAAIVVGGVVVLFRR